MALASGLKLAIRKIKAKIAAVITADLAAWHKMTANTWTGSNRLPDDSGNSNTAALYTGRGLSFDGVNDVVTIGNTGQTVKTVVFYVYPDTTTEVFMQLQSAGAVRIEIASGTLSATGFTSPTLYVNGAAGSIVAATTWQMIAVTSATGVSASNVLFGQSNTDYGSIDMSNVKFFSTELTAGQIAELYANPEQVLPTGASASDLVGWWPMVEGNGEIIYNYYEGIKNGIISGATYTTSIRSPLPQISVNTGINTPMIFDGINDVVTIGTRSAPTSITIWTKGVNVKVSAYGYGLLYGRVALGFIQNGIRYTPNNTTTVETIGGLTYLVGELFNIAITQTGTTLKSYHNGTLFDTRTTSAINTSSLSSKIGEAYSGYYDGVIYEQAVWSTDLAQADITKLNNGDNVLTVQPGNLLAYWKNTGNENTNWVDLTGNGVNGTVSGAPDKIALLEKTTNKDYAGISISKPNTGELILNADGYALITDAATLDITTNITLEAWVKPFTVAANQTAIGKNNAYALNITSGAKLQFQRWSSTTSGTVASSASLAVDTWYHIAATYDGTTTKLYIDGAEDTSSGSITGAIDATATDVLMGALTSSTQLFSGYLDSVKIYDEVKTAAEILENYNAEKNNHQNT